MPSCNARSLRGDIGTELPLNIDEIPTNVVHFHLRSVVAIVSPSIDQKGMPSHSPRTHVVFGDVVSDVEDFVRLNKTCDIDITRITGPQ